MSDLMQIDEYFIEIEGRKIWTRQILRNKEESSPTIVFLHDALGSVAQWKNFPDRLGEIVGCNVVLYDRFGHGLSAAEPVPPDEFFLDREALVILPEVLHLLNVKNPVLYGHSDGGTIALIYASCINSTALILEAAHVLVEDITREGVLKTSMQKDELIPKLEKYHGDKAQNLFKFWSDLWSGDLMQSWNIEHVLKRIDIPTAIIQGVEDNYGSLAQVDKIAKGVTGPVFTYLMESCGHFPHKENPEKVLEYVNEFVERNVLIEMD